LRPRCRRIAPAVTLAAFDRRSVLYRSLIANPGTGAALRAAIPAPAKQSARASVRG
jgi:hypothetical protein